MENSTTPNEQRNELIGFRQRVYNEVLDRRRDAQFELLDALAGSGPIRSLAELSLSPLFHRGCSENTADYRLPRTHAGADMGLGSRFTRYPR